MNSSMLTAIHEAGHAWAYCREGLSLRYVTIRPRQPGLSGICRPWRARRVDPGRLAFIASAGPIAEAMWAWDSGRGDPSGDSEWEDALAGAVLEGGRHDLPLSLGMLDDPASVEAIRTALSGDWQAVVGMAHDLVAEGTLSGRRVRGKVKFSR